MPLTGQHRLNRYLTKQKIAEELEPLACGMPMKRPKTRGMRLPSVMLSACVACKSKLRQVCSGCSLRLSARW